MFFKKKKGQNLKKSAIDSYLSVDIGTEYVKSVVYIVENGEVEVVGYSRVQQKESSMRDRFLGVIALDRLIFIDIRRRFFQHLHRRFKGDFQDLIHRFNKVD